MIILQFVVSVGVLRKASPTAIKLETKGDRTALVYFRNENCKECDQITTLLEGLQQQFKDIVPFLIANCSDEKIETVCSQYKVKRFPHMIMLNPNPPNNKLTENPRPEIYLDDYVLNEIFDWVKENIKLPFSTAPKAEAFVQPIIDLSISDSVGHCFFFLKEVETPLWLYRLAFKGLYKLGFRSYLLLNYNKEAHKEIVGLQIGPFLKADQNNVVCANFGKWQSFQGNFEESEVLKFLKNVMRPKSDSGKRDI